MSKLILILLYISVLLSTQSTFSWCNSAEEDGIISEFQQYLRFPTAHPNPNYKPAQEFIVSKAKSIGLNTQLLEFAKGKPIILLTWTGKNPSWPSILLNSHLDSVPAEPEKWVHDPFQAIKDIKGNIYARGSQDDKCIGMQYLEAINRLKTKGYQPLRTVHVSFVPDEEIGGRDGAGAFVSSKEFKNLHVGFVLDEGQASPDENYRVFYADRIPWNLIIRATGAPGHGSKLYDNSALENLMRSMDAIARFRSAQFDLVKAGLAEPGEVIAVNPVYVKAGTPTPTLEIMFLVLEMVWSSTIFGFPLERQTYDVLQVDEELLHAFLEPYISPFQLLINMTCAGICHFCEDLCIGHHALVVTHYCSHFIMYFLVHVFFIMNISLFWSMTKHKGKHYSVDVMSTWFHWLYDYT